MTAWADYSYYVDTYLAGREPTVSEADFRSYAVNATAYVRRVTGDTIDDSDVPDEARYAVCAISEALYASETARTRGIASETVGDLSVSYESASSRETALAAQLADIVRTWLTPWMYLGVKSC